MWCSAFLDHFKPLTVAQLFREQTCSNLRQYCNIEAIEVQIYLKKLVLNKFRRTSCQYFQINVPGCLKKIHPNFILFHRRQNDRLAKSFILCYTVHRSTGWVSFNWIKTECSRCSVKRQAATYRNNLPIISVALAWYRKSLRVTATLFFTHKKILPTKLLRSPTLCNPPRSYFSSLLAGHAHVHVSRLRKEKTDTVEKDGRNGRQATGRRKKGSNRRAEVVLVRADLCRRKSSVMLDRKLSWTKHVATGWFRSIVSNTECDFCWKRFKVIARWLRVARSRKRLTFSTRCLVRGIITNFVNIALARPEILILENRGRIVTILEWLSWFCPVVWREYVCIYYVSCYRFLL